MSRLPHPHRCSRGLLVQANQQYLALCECGRLMKGVHSLEVQNRQREPLTPLSTCPHCDRPNSLHCLQDIPVDSFWDQAQDALEFAGAFGTRWGDILVGAELFFSCGECRYFGIIDVKDRIPWNPMPGVCPKCSGVFDFISRHESYAEDVPYCSGRGAKEGSEMVNDMREGAAEDAWAKRPANPFRGYSSVHLIPSGGGWKLVGYEDS